MDAENKESTVALRAMRTSEAGKGELVRAIGMSRSMRGWGRSHRQIKVTNTSWYCELESEIGIQLLKPVI